MWGQTWAGARHHPGGLWRAGGPPDQTGSPNQCGILQGCGQGGGVGSPAVSMLGDWSFVALFQHFRELEAALSILPCLGKNSLSFQAMGSASPTGNGAEKC